MRKISTTIAATLAAVALLVSASPASAVEFPRTWKCKDAGGGTYNCKASFVTKVGPKSNYVWATKVCKSRVQNRAQSLGAPNRPEVLSGAVQVDAERWRCNAQWIMVIPVPEPVAPAQ